MSAYISVYYEKRQNEYLSPFEVLWVNKLLSKTIMSWAVERVEGKGYEMNNGWHNLLNSRIKVPRGPSQ